jgi:hypothetical protein
MSDRSQSSVSVGDYYDRLGQARHLRADERAMVTKMVKNTPYQDEITELLGGILVRDMPDGGMGSIKFETTTRKPSYGRQIAEGAFRDRDGMPVSVTLSLDKKGRLFELDVFKADGSPLISYPALEDFEIVERHGKLGWAQ